MWGVISAVALAVSVVEMFGVDAGPLLTVTVTIAQLWFLAFGVWLLARGKQRLANSTP
jgi:putative Ca2+/H+ antiporter (TMEM165/GDT1 family)